jgi:hypothetical protein
MGRKIVPSTLISLQVSLNNQPVGVRGGTIALQQRYLTGKNYGLGNY